MTVKTEEFEELYCFIEAYHAARRIIPTQPEIGRGLYLSRSTVYKRLRQIEALGWIARDGRKQSIMLKGLR